MASKRSELQLPAEATLYVTAVGGQRAITVPARLLHRSVVPLRTHDALRLSNMVELLGVTLERPRPADLREIYEAWDKGHVPLWLATRRLPLRVNIERGLV